MPSADFAKHEIFETAAVSWAEWCGFSGECVQFFMARLARPKCADLITADGS